MLVLISTFLISICMVFSLTDLRQCPQPMLARRPSAAELPTAFYDERSSK